MRRHIAVAAGVLTSAVFLWFAFRDADFAAIGAALLSADATFAVPFLLSLFVFYWLKSSRWGLLLSPAGTFPARELFPMVMIGYAGTAVLPMQMGEFVRAYIASRRYTLRYSLVLSSIGMERIFDLLTILALLGAVLAFGQSTPDILIDAGYVIATITLLGLVMAIALATHTETVLSLCRWLLTPLPDGFRNAVVEQLEAAAEGLQSVTQPRLLLRIAFNSVLQWGLMGICIWCSLLALDIHIPLAGVVLVLVATIVGISLPTSPGYVGNIQLAFVVALQPFGIGAGEAIAASVFYHVLAYCAVVITGFGFLHKMGLGLGEIRQQAQASADAGES